jgi:hypothetical protein
METTQRGYGMMTTLWATCNKCKDQVEMAVNVDDYTSWENGELIQVAMPYLSAGEREVLISGVCGTCFDKMFAPDPIGDADTEYDIEFEDDA